MNSCNLLKVRGVWQEKKEIGNEVSKNNKKIRFTKTK